MGLSGISPWSLLIILAIAVVLFGSKRLRDIGGDVGKAIKDFREQIDHNSKDRDQE